MYNSLVYHTSWTRLLFKFIFDSRDQPIFAVQERVDRSGVALNAEVQPDIDYLRATQPL